MTMNAVGMLMSWPGSPPKVDLDSLICYISCLAIDSTPEFGLLAG